MILYSSQTFGHCTRFLGIVYLVISSCRLLILHHLHNRFHWCPWIFHNSEKSLLARSLSSSIWPDVLHIQLYIIDLQFI